MVQGTLGWVWIVWSNVASKIWRGKIKKNLREKPINHSVMSQYTITYLSQVKYTGIRITWCYELFKHFIGNSTRICEQIKKNDTTVMLSGKKWDARVSKAILITGKKEDWHVSKNGLINQFFFTFVMSWHAMKRFSFPAPVFQHLRRSFNKVSFHMSATVTEKKKIKNDTTLQTELLFTWTRYYWSIVV